MPRPLALAFALAAMLMFAAAQAQAEEITGTIKTVDRDRESFVVTVGDRDYELEVDGSTEFEVRGRRARQSDALQSGNRVRVEFSGDTASRVSVVG